MILHYAIDTSILTRLVTEDPLEISEVVFRSLEELLTKGAQIWVSSITVGECYMAVQHHYRVPKKDIKMTLLDLIESGWVTPMDGEPVLDALRSVSGPGLIDRLIAIQGSKQGMKTLTLDRKMGKLSDCEVIKL
jgi:predicted nucleic acid-binding protein